MCTHTFTRCKYTPCQHAALTILAPYQCACTYCQCVITPLIDNVQVYALSMCKYSKCTYCQSAYTYYQCVLTHLVNVCLYMDKLQVCTFSQRANWQYLHIVNMLTHLVNVCLHVDNVQVCTLSTYSYDNTFYTLSTCLHILSMCVDWKGANTHCQCGQCARTYYLSAHIDNDS